MDLLMKQNPNSAMLAPFPEKVTAMSFALFVCVTLQTTELVGGVKALSGLTP
jgi:hypothetical protein